MSNTFLTLHRINKVTVSNVIHDDFETIKIIVTSDKGEEADITLFSEGKRMPLDVIKTFTITGENSRIANEES